MVPLLRNGIEVSLVTNTSISWNTVTNSNVSYMQRLAKDRYALWMDNRLLLGNQPATVHIWTVGLGDLLGPKKATLGWISTVTRQRKEREHEKNKKNERQSSQWASWRRQRSAVESKTDSQEAIVNGATVQQVVVGINAQGL
jgi:hypothetical protein